MSDTLYLIARVGGRGIAIEAAQVDSVVDIDGCVGVPGAPATVLGLTALRSRVVTVIDTLAAIGLPAAAPREARAVITCVDGHHYALMVERVEDVTMLAHRALPSGLALDPAWAAIAAGMVEREGEALLVVNLERIVPRGAIAA